MSDTLPDNMPSISFDNHAVPSGMRGTSRNTNRATVRRLVQDMMYKGEWRYAYPFSTAYGWFVIWLRPFLMSDWQKRNATAAQAKVNAAGV